MSVKVGWLAQVGVVTRIIGILCSRANSLVYTTPMIDDPISRDVFQHQVNGIAGEMSSSLRLSAFSSIVFDMRDYACGLFTPDAEMIAQADTIPAQLGIMSSAIKHMFEAIPRETWRPGDIIACNDPYRGCAHTMDMCLFAPVFFAGRLQAITSTIAHHVDIGGRLPGSTVADNAEVFGEGLIFPPLKLFAEGEPNRLVFDFLSANVRIPQACKGDLRAQVAGCRTGERRLGELLEHYGADRFTDLTRACLGYAETYTRRAIANAPDGTAQAAIVIEDDITSEQPIVLKAKVTLESDRLEIDLRDSCDQREFALNCPVASSISMAHYAAKCIFTADIAQNEGCVRPITTLTRHGSILDPRRPAAVGSRHHMQQAVADLVLKALTMLVPEQGAAGTHISDPLFTVSGIDDRPGNPEGSDEKAYFVIADGLGGGMGASLHGDGLDAVDTHSGNCALISAEIMETVSPLRVLRTGLNEGSGGRGKYRGGLGMYRDYELLSGNAMFTCVLQRSRDDTRAWGFEGGGPGGKAAVMLNPGTTGEVVFSSKVIAHRIEKGDVFRLVGAGGGGWGDPQDRKPALIERDREGGYL